MGKVRHMSKRIHSYLDGELPASELSAEELHEARLMENRIECLRVETDTISVQDLASPVMDRIATLPSVQVGETAGWIRAIKWFTTPLRVSLALRPTYALAAALVVIAVATQLWPERLRQGVGTADPTTQVFVRFEIMAPDAREVQLAGSFTDWEPDVSLRSLGGGLWTALVPLEPGVHNYAFRVDGEHWVVDPSAPQIADGFGGYNSQLSLILASN